VLHAVVQRIWPTLAGMTDTHCPVWDAVVTVLPDATLPAYAVTGEQANSFILAVEFELTLHRLVWIVWIRNDFIVRQLPHCCVIAGSHNASRIDVPGAGLALAGLRPARRSISA